MEETETNNKVAKKGYEFLRELCSFNADFNSFEYGRENPITNRVQYIINCLDKHNMAYTIDKFQPIVGVSIAVDGSKNFVNIVVNIEGNNTEISTVFLAHHDVSNMASENCQDNTASVANLLNLCVRLSKNKPENNVIIAFVDAEEIVVPSICGSQRLSQNILKGRYGHVKYAVNLELTANGRNYWMSFNNQDNLLAHHIREIHPSTHRVSTPYNDGFVMEKEGIPAVCVGSLKYNELADVKSKGYCQTWSMCHSLLDTFESQANEEDMDLFVSWLETLI